MIKRGYKRARQKKFGLIRAFDYETCFVAPNWSRTCGTSQLRLLWIHDDWVNPIKRPNPDILTKIRKNNV